MTRRNVITALVVLSFAVFFIAAKKNILHEIDQSVCTQCGDCIKACNDNAIEVFMKDGKKRHRIDPTKCTQCGDCIDACEEEAIMVVDVKKLKPAEKK